MAIKKDFVFPDFRSAFAAMAIIAIAAEKMDHHPEWTNVYNRLSVTLSTHSKGMVTEKDIALAVEIEKAVKPFVKS